MICSSYVHDMIKLCSCYVHAMFMLCMVFIIIPFDNEKEYNSPLYTYRSSIFLVHTYIICMDHVCLYVNMHGSCMSFCKYAL